MLTHQIGLVLQPVPNLAFLFSLLAKAKVNLNYQDNDGWTALHGAAKWGQPDAIDSLIKHGADIHLVNIFVSKNFFNRPPGVGDTVGTKL